MSLSHRLVALAASALLSACASSGAFRAGQQAEQLQDYDRAVVEFTKAVKEHPENRDARLSLDRAKVRAGQDHFNRGRRLQAASRLDEALVELQLAAELNPGSGDIDDTLRDVRSQIRNQVAVGREGRTQLQTLIDRSKDLTAPGTALPADLRLPATLAFRDASSRDVYTAIARMTGINVVFDPTFREQPVTIDLRQPSLEEALASVSQATRTFYRVSAQRTITVIPDTPAKRREYEEEVVRTFYLSNGQPTHRAHHRHQRALDQGHARAHRRGRQADFGHRQGAARGDHRRRAARGRPDAATRIRAATGLAWLSRRERAGRCEP
jgi:general secretion pathway protein D